MRVEDKLKRRVLDSGSVDQNDALESVINISESSSIFQKDITGGPSICISILSSLFLLFTQHTYPRLKNPQNNVRRE